jgi:hypothetical protein
MAKTITFQEGELAALVNLIDLGVQKGGLSTARAASHIVNLIEAAPNAVENSSSTPVHGNGARSEGQGEA